MLSVGCVKGGRRKWDALQGTELLQVWSWGFSFPKGTTATEKYVDFRVVDVIKRLVGLDIELRFFASLLGLTLDLDACFLNVLDCAEWQRCSATSLI